MLYLTVYLAGVIWALVVMRDPWPARVGTALVWPVGPAAFVAVVSILLLAAAFLWPFPVIGGAVLLGALGYLLL